MNKIYNKYIITYKNINDKIIINISNYLLSIKTFYRRYLSTYL